MIKKIGITTVKWFSSSWKAFGKAILFLLVLETLLLIVISFGPFKDKTVEPLSLLDEGAPTPESYREAEWFSNYVSEFEKAALNISWRPYVYWKTKPFEGKYINVDLDSNRKTWAPDNSSKAAFRIFMMGGSTMWGWGARDDFTIASLVSKILYQEHQIHAEVINLSEIGYVTTQEVIRLITELQKENFPQLVIFYDGLNDVCSTLRAGQTGKAGIPWDEVEREKAFEKEHEGIFKKIIQSWASHSSLYYLIEKCKQNHSGSFPKPLLDSQVEPVAEDVVRVYKENMRVVKSIATAYGFKTLFYWQPIILTKKDLTETEQKLLDEGEGYLHAKPLYEAVARKIALLEKNDFSDISNILSYHSLPFYIDYFHIDEKGNEIVARRIVQDILKQF